MRERLKAFERTKSLQLWHDGSCITNHGHFHFCINVLYDRAVFYTSSEYVHLCLTDDITHCYHQKVKSLAEKQHKVLQGKFGWINWETIIEKLEYIILASMHL